MSDEVKGTPGQKSFEDGANQSWNQILFCAAVQVNIYLYDLSQMNSPCEVNPGANIHSFIFSTHFVLRSGWQRFAGANIILFKTQCQTKGCILHILFSVEFQDTYVTTIIGEKHFLK